MQNLRAFAKLCGYVRYFHPSDEASAIDWEGFAIHGVRQVRDTASPEDLGETLKTLFTPIAPTVQIYSAQADRPTPASVLTLAEPTDLELVAWQHVGVGLENVGPYRSIRLHRETTERPGGPRLGVISQSVDATEYRGHEVRLEAVVRTDVSGAGNQAQLWLRVDRPGEEVGFFDNMQDRAVTASDRGRYRITGSVDDDAERIARRTGRCRGKSTQIKRVWSVTTPRVPLDPAAGGAALSGQDRFPHRRTRRSATLKASWVSSSTTSWVRS